MNPCGTAAPVEYLFMDFRNSKLIVALSIVFALVISTMVYLGFRDAGRDLMERSGWKETSEENYPSYNRRYVRAGPRDSTRDEIRSARKLREMVQVKDRMLQSRTEQLRQATGQRDRLQMELVELQRRHARLQKASDQTMKAFVELSSQIDVTNEQTVSVARQVPRSAADQTDQDEDLGVEIELIQWQIEQANQRVAELELTALRELVRSSEATQALVSTGSAAVPALLDRLADEDPDVRQWAVSVLGQIGPEASLAIEALLVALNDENEDVRASARIALDRIENRF